MNPMDSESVISRSAYLLFYRRRSSKALGGDLSERIQAYTYQHAHEIMAEPLLVDEEDPPVHEISLPPYSLDTPNSSPPSSTASEPSMPERYVPFTSTGRKLGGIQDGDSPVISAPSNPFASGSTWGGTQQFATTSSEGSARTVARFAQHDDSSATEWSNSD